MEYTVPKGLFDIVPSIDKIEDSWKLSERWHYVEEIMRKTAHDYGFKELRTPLFERSELFVRSVGETSDIVSKEMYTFTDKGGRSMTLRPEGTAPAMRAFVEHQMHQKSGVCKLFYIGPMFRYERPQAGRFRQHHQFGIEAIGISTAEQDVEIIDLLCTLYTRLGLKNLKVLINTVGTAACRERYAKVLKDYLGVHMDSLSEESKVRFHKNPLRILDSKDPQDQMLTQNAPQLFDSLSEEAKERFNKTCLLLKHLDISFDITPKLVRGLDYYNGTVFEVISSSLGAHNTVGAGGRYDGLIEAIGGPKLPSIGCATGIERVLQVMEAESAPFPHPEPPIAFFIGLGESAMKRCFDLLCTLRHKKVAVEMDLGGKKIQQGLKRASQMQALYAVIIGEEEIAQHSAQLKNMRTQEMTLVPLESLADKLLSIAHTVINRNPI